MRYLIVILFLNISLFANAQDQLFKKDNSKIEVKILEINQTEIKYKLFTYQDGPTIIISKKDVALIIYQNGVHEVVTAVEEVPVQAPVSSYNSYTYTRINYDSIRNAEFYNLVSTKNLVLLNMLEPLNGSFNLTYLREFAQNYLHVYVPVAVGFANPYFTQSTNSLFIGYNGSGSYGNSSSGFTVSDYILNNKKFDIGLGIHFQTSGKRSVTHFIGPYVGMAQFTGTYKENTTVYDPNNYTSSSVSIEKTFNMNRLYVMLDNGLLFRITKNFNMMLLAGVGYHIDTYKANNPSSALNLNKNQFPVNAFKFAISFGYRF